MKVFTQLLCVLSLIATCVACGGGGGGGGSPAPVPLGTAPRISNLTYAPEFVFVDEGGGQTDIFGSVDFTDPDGDLSMFVLDVLNASGQLVANVSEAIDAAGVTAGTLQGVITIGTTIVGDYSINIYLVDSTSKHSSTLSGEFRVAEFPYVPKAAMPSPRLDFSVGAANGQIYLIGGRDALAPITPKPQIANVDRYDPVTNQWFAVAPLPLAVAQPIVAAVGEKLYAIGGRPDNLMLGAVVQEYDPATGDWTTKGPMPEGCWGAAVAVHDGKIYISGGDGPGVTYASLIVYDPATNGWSSGSPMTDARSGPGGASIDGRILVYGGYGVLHTSDGGYLRSLESYDPIMDIWTMSTEGEPRRDFGIAAVDGKMYTFGGNNVARSLNWARAYDPTIASWRAKVPLPVSSGYIKAVTIADKIYLFTTNETFEYTPANDPS